jgi:hypothetical protein
MAGLVTSICLAFPVVDALADGLEVCFVEDAVGDLHKHLHDTAVLRLAHAGAVANSTIAVITEWFRDWKSPLATQAREIIVPYLQAITALERAPEFRQPRGVPVKSASR